MADQYVGDSMDAYYNTVDVGGTLRVINVDETVAAPPDIDCTHKGDTSLNLKEGIPGGLKSTASLEALDEAGGVSAMKDFSVNSLDTLFLYPQGRTHTYEELTIQNARYLGMSETIPYDGAAAWTASFEAKNSMTRGTYDSSP